MKALLQRVSSASVRVEQELLGSIRKGLVILLGIESEDDDLDIQYIVNKSLNLRIFDDDSGKWQKAMDLIAQSVDVVDSCRFIRFYETDESGKEQPISLDIAKL